MADLKKIPFQSVADQDIVTMSFDENPNIPTANYSEETLSKINDVISKKIKAERIKKLIDDELKQDEKIEDNDMNMMFSFKSM